MKLTKSPKILKAWQVAAKSHLGQRYGDKFYTKHLLDVFKTAHKFDITSEDVLLACILHDTLEDTDLSKQELESLFGTKVLDLVQRVTNEPGMSRKERFKATYPKIKGSLGATTVKLCDRISNVTHSIKTKSPKLLMYKKEHESFKSGVKVLGICDSLWDHLDSLLK